MAGPTTPAYQHTAVGPVYTRGDDAFLRNRTTGKIVTVGAGDAGRLLDEDPDYLPVSAEDVAKRDVEIARSTLGNRAAAFGENAAAGAADVPLIPVRMGLRAGYALGGAARKLAGKPDMTPEEAGLADPDKVTGRAVVEQGMSALNRTGGGDAAQQARFDEQYRQDALERRDVLPGTAMAGTMAGQLPYAMVGPGAALGELAQGAGLGIRLGAQGLGGAIEGAAFGESQATDDAYIEDKPLTAEKLMASMGWGALVGGVASTGLGALGEGYGAARGRLTGRAAREAVSDDAAQAFGGRNATTAAAGDPVETRIAEAADSGGLNPAARREAANQEASKVVAEAKAADPSDWRNFTKTATPEAQYLHREAVLNAASNETARDLTNVLDRQAPIYSEIDNLQIKRGKIAEHLAADNVDQTAVIGRAQQETADLRARIAEMRAQVQARQVDLSGRAATPDMTAPVPVDAPAVDEAAKAQLLKSFSDHELDGVFAYVPIEDIGQSRGIAGHMGEAEQVTQTAGMKAGKAISPVELVLDSRGKLTVSDGAHRVAAAQINGFKRVPAIVPKEVADRYAAAAAAPGITNLEREAFDALKGAGSGSRGRVLLADIRDGLGGTKVEQDAALRKLQQDGRIVLMRDDNPSALKSAERARQRVGGLEIAGNERQIAYIVEGAEPPPAAARASAMRAEPTAKPIKFKASSAEKALLDMDSIVRDHETRILAAKDGASAVGDFDSMRRELSKRWRSTRGSAKALQGYEDRALMELVEPFSRDEYNKAAQSLMDESFVGARQAAAQKAVNNARVGSINGERYDLRPFVQQVGSEEGADFGGRIFTGNQDAIKGMLSGLGDGGGGMRADQFARYVDSQEATLKAISDNYTLSAGAKAKLDESLASLQKMRGTVSTATDAANAVNRAKAGIEADQIAGGFLGKLAASTTVGAVQGGASGAAKGFARGMLGGAGPTLQLQARLGSLAASEESKLAAWLEQKIAKVSGSAGKGAAVVNQTANRVDARVGSSLDGYFAKLEAKAARVGEAAKKPANLARAAAAPTALKLFMGDDKKPAEAYRKRTEQLLVMNQNMGQGVRDRMGSALGGISETAPRLTQHVAVAASRGVNYLLAHTPVPLREPSVMQPTYRPVPSELEIAEFAKRWSAVTDPLTVLEDFKKGMVTYEQVDALKNVYPSLYRSIQVEAMQRFQKLDAAGVPVQYNDRLQADLMFDLQGAGDPTLDAGFALKVSGMMQASAHKVSGPHPNGKPVNVAKSYAPESQAIGATLRGA